MREHPANPPLVLPLEAGHNFREVGGYSAADGRRLRRALVWRSAGLNRLTARDCITIQALGIRTIVDLRGVAERELLPTAPALANSARIVSWDEGGAKADTALPDSTSWRALTLAELRADVASRYRRLPETHGTHLQGLLRVLLDEPEPVVVHCTAGKDRTGIAIAIFLELLGVPRDEVLWDYEQTNAHLDKSIVAAEAALGMNALPEWLSSLSPDGRDLVLGADRTFLLSALAGLEEAYGSVEEFAHRRLGLAVSDLDRLRGKFLEETL